MLHPSPEIQKRLEKYQTIDPIEAKAIKQERRREKLIRALSGAASLLSIVGVLTAEYAQDVRNNQELQANSIITIEDRGDPLDKINNDKAIVNIEGTGTVNAIGLTTYIAPAVQHIRDGRIWDVGYNDAPLKPEDIADKLIKKAEDEGVDSLAFIGDSSGGDIAMQVEERIRQKSNIGIAVTFLMFTPNGIDGLRVDHQQQMAVAKSFAKFPGAIYSSPIRIAGEMAFRSDNYTHGSLTDNVSNFFTTLNDVRTSVAERKLPGTWLMVDQILQIENADLKTRYENLANTPLDQVHTPTVFIGTDHDPIVNDEKSAKEIQSYADAAHTPFTYINVPDVEHGNPAYNTDHFVKALAEHTPEIQGMIKEQEEIAESHQLIINRSRGIPQ